MTDDIGLCLFVTMISLFWASLCLLRSITIVERGDPSKLRDIPDPDTCWFPNPEED